MTDPLPDNLALIISCGSLVVSRVEIKGPNGKPTDPAGVVGVVTAAPIPKDENNCNDHHGSEVPVMPFDGTVLDRDLAEISKQERRPIPERSN